MLYGLYWVQMMANRIPYLLKTYPNRPSTLGFWTDHVTGASVDTLRVVAVILLFAALYLAWGPKKQSFYAVKKYFATAILFEGIYWLAFSPDLVRRLVTGMQPQILFVGFIIQAVTVGPLLVILSYKAWHYKVGERNNLIKWGCIAGVAYIFGILINNLLKWFGMSGQQGLLVLFTGVSTWGVLNTAVTCTLALVFAIIGSYMLIKGSNRKLAVRLLGLAVFLFGLYFTLFIAYSWFAPRAWAFVMLTEIWPAALIGLGLGLLREKL